MATTNPSKHTSSSKSSKKRSAHKVHTLPLATMAALLTAATYLGSQPAMAVTANKVTTPTQAGVVRSLTNSTGAKYQNREADVVVNNPEWLKTPSILEFQRYRATNDENKDNKKINSNEHGSDEYNTLIKKTDMYAHIETIDGAKYLVFDVFFNNDAQSMVTASKRQWYIWQVPYQIAKLKSDGLFENDTIRDLRFDAYKLKDASQNDKIKRKMNFTLSRDFGKFEKVDNQSTTINFPNDHEKSFGGNKNKSSMFQYSLGPNQTNEKQYKANMKTLFHGNFEDYALGKATWLDGPYSGKNYGIGIQTSEVNLAFHMHAAVKLNDTAINEKATTYDEKYANIHNAWTWADSATYGSTTSSSYAWISGRDPESDEDKKLKRHKDDSEAPKIYYNGKEITDKQTITLHKGDKLSFTTTDDKGYIEKFSISGLAKDPTVTQGAGSKDKPLSSGDITVTQKMSGKKVTITSEDGSGNVTTRTVKVKVTTLAKENPLYGKTITTTVGEPLPPLTKINEFVTDKNGNKLKQQPTLEWNGKPIPNTNTVGVFTHSIKGTYSDDSTSIAKTKVTINVRPQKPVIDTNLTDLAGKKGQKVTVSVGSGIPEGTTTTVKLFDKDNNEIGSTTTIKDGKAEITVKDGIPEGDVYATTTVKKPDENTPKVIIKGFELTSEKSEKKQATAPKDAQDPTITATSSPVTVGQDLKIHIVAKDDVKVEKINYIDALMGANLLQSTDIVGGRASVSKTTDTDQEQVLDLTVTKMQPKEVGTHTLTLTVTDSAGKTGNVTLTITVKPAAPTVTVPASGDDQGSATITPAADTDSLVITYTPEGEANEKTITVTKGADNKWKKGDGTPEGVTVDEGTGKVTIPAKKVKDGSSVTAIDKKGDISSDSATGNVGKNPAKPTVSDPKAENKTGKDKTTVSGKTTPGAKVTISKDGQKVTEVTAGDDGNFTVDIDKQEPNTKLKLTPSKDGATGTPVTATVTGENPAAEKPAAPTVTTPTEGKDQGSATITPAKDTDSLEITYTPEGDNTNPTNFTVKKENGKWKGENTPEGVTVDENTGKVTIPADKVKDGSEVKAKDKKGNDTSSETTGTTGTNPTTPATKPAAPKVEPQNDGSVEVTPADGTDSLEITYTPEGKDTTKTITVKKGADNKWKKGDDTPDGVTVDETTGKVTIPADKVKDGSSVTAIDKKGDNSSDKATGTTGTNPTAPATKPDAPTVTVPANGDGQGSATITPAADTDSLEITYTPEGENTNPTNFTVKKGNDNKWKIDGNTPDGVKVDETTGKVTIPADKIKDNSDVKAKDKKGENTSSEATGNAGKNPTTPEATPAAPKVEPQNDGSVEVTPADGTDSLEITYTPEGENTNPTNFTVKKGNDNKWKIDGNTPDGVKVDENTGKVTIPADKVKDDSDVTAKNSKNGTESDNATGQAGNNDGNSGSGTGSGSGSDTGNSNSSESGSGNDSTSNNGGSASGSTTGGSSSTDSGAQNGTNESTKSGNEVPAKHSSQLVKTGAEVEQVGLIGAMIGVLGAAAAFFSRKKNRE